MKQYLELVEKILEEGVERSDRTGTGRKSIFGYQMHFDLEKGFPLVTTKKVHLKSIIHELIWFLAGSTNIKYLKDNGVSIWDEWADENGDLGPVYGAQWRSWPDPNGGKVDQIKNLVESIKNNPNSTRHIVSAWNPALVDEMALPPCHALFQFFVADSKISCQLYQRSADVFLGVPFNIASYALLTMMIAQVCNLKPGKFVHTLGDAHLYLNHLDQAKLQISRKPFNLPTIKINSEINKLEDFTYEDFEILNYESHPGISAQFQFNVHQANLCYFKNNVIGNENKLPWNISEDLKRFKELTSNNWIVMGRKTFDSIGRPLPNRKNIVLSKNKNLKIDSVEVFNSPKDVIDFYKNNSEQKDLYVIGGNYIYELFFEYCEYLYITYVDKEYLGDAFFPKVDWNEWKLISEENRYDDKEEVNFYFRDYERI